MTPANSDLMRSSAGVPGTNGPVVAFLYGFNHDEAVRSFERAAPGP